MSGWVFAGGIVLVLIYGIGKALVDSKSGRSQARKAYRRGATYWKCSANHNHRTPAAARRCSAAQEDA